MKIAAPFLFLLLATAPALFAQADRTGTFRSEGDLIWSDEFEGTGEPDDTKWERQEYNRRINENGPDGWWSKEDSYLDGNGNLVIRIRKIEDRNDDGDSCDFSVGALRTKGKFEQLYGRFEIRCQLPTQPGWWVAFWMMQGDVGSVGNGGVDGTEVDIMEGFGWTNSINYAFHWDGYGDDHQSTGIKRSYPGIREGFHTFSMEWYPEMYVFYIDGEETWRSQGGGVCDQPGYIKVTGEIWTVEWAISNGWANHPKDALYPDSFLVDYIRVYEIGEYQEPVATGPDQASEPLSIYPNPVDDHFRVKWDPDRADNSADIIISNLSGQYVKSFHQVRNNTGLSINDLPAGVYFISLYLDQSLVRGKFIKQ